MSELNEYQLMADLLQHRLFPQEFKELAYLLKEDSGKDMSKACEELEEK